MSRVFAYNPGSQAPTGCTQLGDIAIGVDNFDYNSPNRPGGLQWWAGPDESLGYVIAEPVPNMSQPNPLGLSAGVGFWRSDTVTDASFIKISSWLAKQNFGSGTASKSWLNSNGYWTSWTEAAESIPSDFLILTQVYGSSLTYNTYGDYLTLDLKEFLDPSIVLQNTNEIVRNGNDLFITTNFGASYSGLIKLTNCGLRDGKYLKFDQINHIGLTSSISHIHGMSFYKNNLYLSNRLSTVVPKVVKVDASTLMVSASMSLPSTFLGFTTNEIISYKDSVYILPSLASNSGRLVKFDLNLSTYSVIVTTGTSSSPSRRVRSGSAFLIYNDEVYIPIFNNTTAGNSEIGMEVWSLNGVLQRSTYNQVINAGTPTTRPLPHWMGIFNDKLIISNAIMAGASIHRSLVRMNITTLAIEESIPIETLVTDDNTIFSDGYIYLNGEAPPSAYFAGTVDINPGATFSPTASLIKIKYNDFTDIQYLTNLGFGSYGSLDTRPYLV